MTATATAPSTSRARPADLDRRRGSGWRASIRRSLSLHRGGDRLRAAPEPEPRWRECSTVRRTRRFDLSRHERAQILNRIADRLQAEEDDFATLITLESGLALKDTRYEMRRAQDVFRFAAMEALRDDGQVFACDTSANGRTGAPIPCASRCASWPRSPPSTTP